MKRNALVIAGVIALFALLTFVYLSPGSSAMFEGRTDTVMSDGTDPSALPYVYEQIVHIFKTHPSHLLYGSVYIEASDPERGFTYWTPWSERVFLIVSSYLFPPEQYSTAVVFGMLMLNALAMFALARYLRWNIWLAIGAGMAWAFNPFTRARAKVHMAMAGTFHIPLIFLALFLIARGRGRRSLIAAAACLLLACSTIHIFIVTSLFLTPLLLIFLQLQPETRANPKRVWTRLALSALPAVLFLGFNFTVPVPPDAKMTSKDAYPHNGATPDGRMHPFLTIYSAHLIDYLAGDIALQPAPSDLNPLRELVNEHILNNLAPSNSHERTNGIRWSLLILAALAIASIKKSPNKRLVWYFLGLAIFGVWLSLPPDFPFTGAGPSGWLYMLVPQVRVTNRAGLLAAFSVLMLAGLWLSERPRSWLLLPGLFPLLMLLDYPPLITAMPMSPLLPAFPELQRVQGPCGAGMYFPWVDNYRLAVVHYRFLQQLRGSDCLILNGMGNEERLVKPGSTFPATMEFINGLPNNLVVGDQIEKLVKCVPLEWIVFDPAVPGGWRDQMCARLGWKMTHGTLCRTQGERGRKVEHLPDQCL